MKRIFATAMLSLLLSPMLAKAEDYAKVAFIATYTQSGSEDQTLKIKSDGKGHMKSESIVGGRKVILISDYPNKIAYSFVEGNPTAWQIPLKPLEAVHDEESAKKANAKSLGIKVVSGQRCHGWEYNVQDSKTTIWIGDDIDYLVKSEETFPDGKKITIQLTSLSKIVPSANEFKLPPGCKTKALPAK